MTFFSQAASRLHYSLHSQHLLAALSSCLLFTIISSCGTITPEPTNQAESVCDVRKLLPISQGNTWIYTTTTTNAQGQQITGKDTLIVQGINRFAGVQSYRLSKGFISIPDSSQMNLYPDNFITPLEIFPRCGCSQTEWWLPLLRCTPSNQWQTRDTLRQTLRVNAGAPGPEDVTILSIYNCTVILREQNTTIIDGRSYKSRKYDYKVQFHQEFIPDRFTSEWDNITEVKFSIQFAENVGITLIEGNGFRKTLSEHRLKN